ncbi:MAG: hypothetical protein RMJ56_04280 [Gemmataceae bacterium]|nr:hypothetical protein [Gemmata sp.]MDW8196807.1 hypothetical protein [Gemmataceae bacterium]
MRGLSFFVFVGTTLAASGQLVSGQPPVAPMPREIRPDGTRAPAPPPAAAEDPAVLIERIIQNSKKVGEKLAQSDTSAETRQTQNQILKDIDALLNRPDNPPPDPNSNPDSPQNPMNQPSSGNPDNKAHNKDNPSNKNDMPRGGGMDQNSGMPMNSMNDTPPMPMGDSRRPRRGDPNSTAKKDPPSSREPQPMNPASASQPPPKKNPSAPTTVAGGQPGGKMAPQSLLPFEEDVAKDIWGHLPDKLRQQMTQYYREDVTPKYSELLRLYYSSLSEKTTSPAPPRK